MTDQTVNIWLDDIRHVPFGWVSAATAKEAIALLNVIGKENVGRLSLDHDLGTCEACGGFKLDAYGLPKSCEHNGTGYDVVCWMEEHGFWPKTKPTVHSQNPVGRQRMQRVIDRAYDGGML